MTSDKEKIKVEKANMDSFQEGAISVSVGRDSLICYKYPKKGKEVKLDNLSGETMGNRLN